MLRMEAKKAMKHRIVLAALTVAGGLAWGQSAPPAVILDMRIENRVVYWGDTPDVSKLATNPSSTTPVVARTFATFMSIADIVSINAHPVKGTSTIRPMPFNFTPNPTPAT